MMNRMRTWSSYVRWKKHFCPDCKTQLNVIRVSKFVNSRSEEAKYFDFDAVIGFAFGDVEFIWDELKCPNCGRQITEKEMRSIEREEKKKKNEEKKKHKKDK